VGAGEDEPLDLWVLVTNHSVVPDSTTPLGSSPTIAASLVLSTRAVEKHTNSIFSKLGLSEEIDVNRMLARGEPSPN
jgi:hypothetical protein